MTEWTEYTVLNDDNMFADYVRDKHWRDWDWRRRVLVTLHSVASGALETRWRIRRTNRGTKIVFKFAEDRDAFSARLTVIMAEAKEAA